MNSRQSGLRFRGEVQEAPWEYTSESEWGRGSGQWLEG